ncbi:hypothetical protein GCM10022419_034080 [Nonomuraea rosea]|uniref:Uncharacterized protein n=1 Tax=Nonomuraea rosea TaxID=638574 RepID=A0ABP6WFB7_9ACTN
MSLLLLVTGGAVVTLAGVGIKGLVWLAGRRPGRLLPRDPHAPVQMWVW